MSKPIIDRYVMLEGVSQEKRIKDALKKLKLPTMISSLDEINKRAVREQITYLEFIDLLLEKEMYFQEGYRQKIRLGQARFPHEKRLKDYDFNRPKLEIDKRLVNELASCRFIDSASNLVIYGVPSVGKTHLSVALGIAAIEKGKNVKFFKLRHLLEKLEKMIKSGQDTHNFLNTLIRPKLLIIDDMDNFETSPQASVFLLSLIEQRYETNSTIFVANESFTDYYKLFGGEKRTAKIIERIFHHCEVLRIKGDSQRLKDKLDKLQS